MKTYIYFFITVFVLTATISSGVLTAVVEYQDIGVYWPYVLSIVFSLGLMTYAIVGKKIMRSSQIYTVSLGAVFILALAVSTYHGVVHTTEISIYGTTKRVVVASELSENGLRLQAEFKKELGDRTPAIFELVQRYGEAALYKPSVLENIKWILLISTVITFFLAGLLSVILSVSVMTIKT